MGFFAELKRRNVYRAAVFYAASGWLLVQVATQVFPLFHIAEWVMHRIVVGVLIGFPFALLFAWFYEWTPEGFKRDSDVDHSVPITRATGKKLDRWIISGRFAAAGPNRRSCERGDEGTRIRAQSGWRFMNAWPKLRSPPLHLEP
ncbi:MAG TPA: hypothetical protein VHQ21_00570 [Rhodanobacteraceae bacterium]|jgi:hypothetical protein|nr:hypothetical protein [Rhodanobacteraceae bacterium]